MKIQNSRLAELDGLRGLAALAVFFSHCNGLEPYHETKLWNHLPIRLLWDGAPAVMLFFVLSGFVLSLPYVDGKQKDIAPLGFIVRRVTRLYPAYWTALVLALACRYWVLAHDHLNLLSTWAGGLWAEPVTVTNLLSNFAMVAPGIDTHVIDPVAWSLVIEMKVSLLFPAILLLVRKTSRPIYAVFVLIGLIAISPYLRSLSVLAIFVGGSYLAKYQAPVRAWFAARRLPVKLAALVVGLVLYGITAFINVPDRAFSFIASTGAAVLMLLFLTWPPLTRFATTRPVHFLGEVSYSFYLIHLPILLAVASALYPVVHSIWLCALTALPLALVVSKLVYEAIEMPLHRYGKTLAARIADRKQMSRPASMPT